MTKLELETAENDGVCSIALSGQLNLETAGALTRELVRLEEKRPPVIVLDFRKLQFIDSSGLRLVVVANAGVRREGRRLVIVPGSEAIQRVFRKTLLDQRLDFVEEIPLPDGG